MKSKPKILLAESHEAYLLITGFWLDLLGYEYDVAVSGEEALEKISHHMYSLVLMDTYLPGINGYDLTKIIRQQENRASQKPVAIIGTSVDALAEDYKECMTVGMNDYIPKPFPEKLLEEKLRLFL